jgi:uncharacterized membrane protein (DUF485 family)
LAADAKGRNLIGEHPMSKLSASRILNNPNYRHLITQRDSLAWTLSACVLVLYFGFILLIAFAPGVLTQPISATSVIPVGMLIGVGVILASIVLTAIYVQQANSKFDPMIEAIMRDAAK